MSEIEQHDDIVISWSGRGVSVSWPAWTQPSREELLWIAFLLLCYAFALVAFGFLYTEPTTRFLSPLTRGQL